MRACLFLSQNSPKGFASATTKHKENALHFHHVSHCPCTRPHQSLLFLNMRGMFLPRSLPLLFPLAAILSPKIYTGLLYYFSQVSVQMSSTQKGLPGRSYLNSNSPPPSTCYLSTMFYHSLNSTALHYIIMFICLFLFPPRNVSFLSLGSFFLLCLGHLGHLEPKVR